MEMAKSVIRDFPALDSGNRLLNGCVSDQKYPFDSQLLHSLSLVLEIYQLFECKIVQQF